MGVDAWRRRDRENQEERAGWLGLARRTLVAMAPHTNHDLNHPEARWLLDWASGASTGDGGEPPVVTFEYDAGTGMWLVEAYSFYDGSARFRHTDFGAACKEVRERLTTHPERQRESERNAAALALAMVLHCGADRALEVVKRLEREYQEKPR